MKNLFTKTLLCGVLATSFLLINCQKAPNREVKPKVDPTAKPTAKMGVCTKDVLLESKELNSQLDAIKVELKKDTVDKDALTGMANKFKEQVEKLTVEIEKIKIDEKTKAEGCEEHEGNDPAKKATGKKFIIGQINADMLTLGKEVKAKTGQENNITKAAAAETLVNGQELKIGADLAAVLADEASLNGAVAIADSKIEKEKAADLLKDSKKTACSLVSVDKDIKADALVKIASLSDVEENKTTKRKELKVTMQAVVAATEEARSIIGFACNIAEGKELEAAKEIRKALGTLVTHEIVKTQVETSIVQASGDSTQTSGDSSVTSGDTTPASGDATSAK